MRSASTFHQQNGASLTTPLVNASPTFLKPIASMSQQSPSYVFSGMHTNGEMHTSNVVVSEQLHNGAHVEISNGDLANISTTPALSHIDQHNGQTQYVISNNAVVHPTTAAMDINPASIKRYIVPYSQVINPPPGNRYVVFRQNGQMRHVGVPRLPTRRILLTRATPRFPATSTYPYPYATQSPGKTCQLVLRRVDTNAPSENVYPPIEEGFLENVAATVEVKTECVQTDSEDNYRLQTVIDAVAAADRAAAEGHVSCARTSPPSRLLEWRKNRRARQKKQVFSSPKDKVHTSPVFEPTASTEPTLTPVSNALLDGSLVIPPVKRKRGRPRKIAVDLAKSELPQSGAFPKVISKLAKKKLPWKKSQLKLRFDEGPALAKKRRRLQLRTEEEESKIMSCFQRDGLDAEELDFINRQLHRFDFIGMTAEMLLSPFMRMDLTDMSRTSTRLPWKTPKTIREPRRLPLDEAFSDPALYSVKFYDDPEVEDVTPNLTGCARTDGMFRKDLDKEWKIRARLEKRRLAAENVHHEDGRVVKHVIRKTDAEQRYGRNRYSLRDSSLDDDIQVTKIKRTRFHHKAIRFAPSDIHGWGLFAAEEIMEDDLIIEYIGERVRRVVAEVREIRYTKQGIGSSYLFRVDDETVIDATRQGNYARFINHSCRPNCYAKIIAVEGEKRIFICAKRAVQKGEELTYDYKFPIEEQDKIQCLCLVKGCRRFLN